MSVLAVGLTAILTHPLAARADRVGRVNTGDGQWSIWVVNWVARTLLVEPASVYDANIFYPHRNTLAFSESNLGTGVLGMLPYAATRNPYFTHNVVALLTFIFATLATYYLARYVTGHRGASLVAAVAFGFCPYVFARTAHIQLLATAGIPLALLAFHRLADGPTAARSIALGVVLAAQALTCAYYGIFAGLAVGLGAVFFAATRRLWRDVRYWAAFAGSAALSVVLVLPFFLPYLELQREAGFGRTLDDARMFSADWQAFLASAAWAHRWLHPLLGSWNEVLFPGFIPTAFAAVGVWSIWRGAGPAEAGPHDPGPPKGGPHDDISGAGSGFSDDMSGVGSGFSRTTDVTVVGSGFSRTKDTVVFYALVGILAFWSAFGPAAGLYTVLYHAVPAFSFLRAPGRFGVMVALAVAVLAAQGIAAVLRGRSPASQRVLATVLLLLLVAELATMPLRLPDAFRVPAAYRHLAVLPRGPVAEFPFFSLRSDFPRHAYYMLYSTYHWQPLINGYSDHIPADFRKIVAPLAAFPTYDSFEILAERRARYAVFHLNFYDTRSRQRLLERLAQYQDYLRPLVREDDVWLYEIVAWPR